MINNNIKTVEAEIKRHMPLQRVRAAESRMGYSFANGPRRAQSVLPGKLRRADIRELSGICWYPAKVRCILCFRHGTANQGGTASMEMIRSSLTDVQFRDGRFDLFFFDQLPLSGCYAGTLISAGVCATSLK